MSSAPRSGFFNNDDLALMVDLYELAMAQAYWESGMDGDATFSLFFRKRPDHRNIVLACGQQHVCDVIRQLRFRDEHIERLRKLDMFRDDFLAWLRDFRFSGDVHALPEGTPVFPQEPLLEVQAPVAEAQILESLVMNYVHLETVLASKALRLVMAAGKRPVVDFGMRRMHGLDSAYRGTRAYRIAGLAGTSNVLAGQDFGLPVRGTMAHSFVQAHDDEMDAFRTYARLYPDTVLLVDTYDTVAAVKRITEWLREDKDARISAIRLDSGDLAQLARDCRQVLDDAGFEDIKILASSGLDEYSIAEMVADDVPIDGFGVGTAIGSAKDSPNLELAYKLTEYGGQPRMKNSPGKQSYPAAKQVFRQSDAQGRVTGDVIAHRDEEAEGCPLLVRTLHQGEPVEGAIASLDDICDYAREAVERLPSDLRALDRDADYPVRISDRLKQIQDDTLKQVMPED
ncbi:MAG: nicotinate phosphoribosyltransferase [Marinobacter sp.]|uniref:nicotinate phosphoribosyltransferase n=1 Tax=Marinobacter sp. TaxID=50741 RepID=UPI00299D2411|nr:nicotinate phosphoribosyltransferase [Marinobacter sp.]MDX1634871.1 nicotinate phosphoribosyltransferase [Marinobacter sp.]